MRKKIIVWLQHRMPSSCSDHRMISVAPGRGGKAPPALPQSSEAAMRVQCMQVWLESHSRYFFLLLICWAVGEPYGWERGYLSIATLHYYKVVFLLSA
jgi:hypothetical protein